MFAALPSRADQKLFVLQGQDQLVECQMSGDGVATTVRRYTKDNFPTAFPAASVRMTSGNILRTYNEQHHQTGSFLYDPELNQLKPYDGDAGTPASSSGRALETIALDESFRGDASLYLSDNPSPYRSSTILERFQVPTGKAYRQLFVVDGTVFGITGDYIDQLSDVKSAPLQAPIKALDLHGSNLIAAAVSPWREVFVSDASTKAIRRFVLRDGKLVSNGNLSSTALRSPGNLQFSPDGQLFVVNVAAEQDSVLRYTFTLEGFVDWTAEQSGSVEIGQPGVTDLALVRPYGFVFSEAKYPLKPVKGHGSHFGISESTFAFPKALVGFVQSDKASIGLVEYQPGGHTLVHFHPNMEQIEIVVSGKALWEVGEIEKEVGPGDVIFTPRYVKHGYKVLGDAPFRFYQVEWYF